MQTNTFQCVLATDGVISFVTFLYAHERIQWTTGDRAEGQDGLGGDEAVAAINAGDEMNYFTIPGSMTPDIINIDETSNVGIPGVWMFQIAKSTFIITQNIIALKNNQAVEKGVALSKKVRVKIIVRYNWRPRNGCQWS